MVHYLFLLLLTLLLLGVKLLLKKTHQNRRNLPPGTTGWPFIGETLDLLKANKGGDQSKFVQDRVDRYGSDVFRTSLLGEPMVVMCGPAANKFLFSNEGKKVALWWPPSVQRLMGPSLVTKVGDDGKACKKLMMSFFGVEGIMKFVGIMDDVTRRYFDTHWQGREELKVYPATKSYTFELACRLFMNITEPELVSRLAFHFNIFYKGVIALPLNFPGTRFYKAMKASDSIRTELRTLIRQRREDLMQKMKNGGHGTEEDLLSYLLLNADENGRFLPEEEITNNMLLLLFAGHDTSSCALTFLIKCLAELPHVRHKLLQEQKEIAETKHAGELLRREDLQKMRYTWNVVCEVLRMTPPINGSFREAIEDFTFDGYTIPKGWKIYWNGSFTHKNPKSYERPEEFDETRFEGSGPPPFSYVPFGGGPRMCLGKEFARLEILLFLHNLINRFNWDLLNPNEKVVIDPVPMPINGLPIRLQSLS